MSSTSRVRIWAVGASPADSIVLPLCAVEVQTSYAERTVQTREGRPVTLYPVDAERWASRVVVPVERRYVNQLSETTGTPRPLHDWLKHYVAVSGAQLLVFAEGGGTDSAGASVASQDWYKGRCGPLPPWLLGNRAIRPETARSFSLVINVALSSGEGTYTSFDSLSGLSVRS
jgi:hypothetical protein